MCFLRLHSSFYPQQSTTRTFSAGSCYEKTALGGYTVQEWSSEGHGLAHPTLVLVGTGTELALAVQVAERLFAAHQAKNDG